MFSLKQITKPIDCFLYLINKFIELISSNVVKDSYLLIEPTSGVFSWFNLYKFSSVLLGKLLLNLIISKPLDKSTF